MSPDERWAASLGTEVVKAIEKLRAEPTCWSVSISAMKSWGERFTIKVTRDA